MPAEILNGNEIAAKIRAQLKLDILKLSQNSCRIPKLAVVLVGENPASRVYVGNKKKACAEIGITAVDYTLSDATSQDELLLLLKNLNNDSSIDGILVQLPLPLHINPSVIAEKINPLKDVDGLHPYNLGCLAKGTPLHPCWNHVITCPHRGKFNWQKSYGSRYLKYRWLTNDLRINTRWGNSNNL